VPLFKVVSNGNRPRGLWHSDLLLLCRFLDAERAVGPFASALDLLSDALLLASTAGLAAVSVCIPVSLTQRR
jgi:hypothetical protein